MKMLQRMIRTRYAIKHKINIGSVRYVSEFDTYKYDMKAERKDASVVELDGFPADQTDRMVRIFKPARNASQNWSTANDFHHWRIEMVNEQPKWNNPLMGWTSTNDPCTYQGMQILRFPSKEEAITWAQSKGFKYSVSEPAVPGKGKSYAGN
eukprot:UN34710